jgi:hypothetical protein
LNFTLLSSQNSYKITIKINEKVPNIILKAQARLRKTHKRVGEVREETSRTSKRVQDQDIAGRIQKDQRSLLHRVHMRYLKRNVYAGSVELCSFVAFIGRRFKDRAIV